MQKTLRKKIRRTLVLAKEVAKGNWMEHGSNKTPSTRSNFKNLDLSVEAQHHP